MKIFSWIPRPIKRRNEIIFKQDRTLEYLGKYVGELQNTLTTVKDVWNKNYELVNDNKLGRTRMTAFIDDFIQKTIPIFVKQEEEVK